MIISLIIGFNSWFPTMVWIRVDLLIMAVAVFSFFLVGREVSEKRVPPTAPFCTSGNADVGWQFTGCYSFKRIKQLVKNHPQTIRQCRT